MTEDEYLKSVRKNPWSFPAVEGCLDPPADWTAEAWELVEVQGTVAYDMARSVSKNGELFYNPGYLESLASALRTDQVIRLFLEIRRRSPHRESEFRPEFERGFAQHAADLPPSLTRQEVITALGLDEESAHHLLDDDPDIESFSKSRRRASPGAASDPARGGGL